MLTDNQGEILNRLARTTDKKPKYLVKALNGLNPTDLVEVLKIRVDKKAIGGRVKDNLNSLVFPIKQKFIRALKET
jgi:hypothetical protein